MNIGKSIKEIRKSKKLKQIDLARKSKITQAYLSQLESNKKIPSGNTLKKISDALEVPIPFILFKSLNKNDVKKEKQKIFSTTQPIVEALLEKIF